MALHPISITLKPLCDYLRSGSGVFVQKYSVSDLIVNYTIEEGDIGPKKFSDNQKADIYYTFKELSRIIKIFFPTKSVIFTNSTNQYSNPKLAPIMIESFYSYKPTPTIAVAGAIHESGSSGEYRFAKVSINQRYRFKRRDQKANYQNGYCMCYVLLHELLHLLGSNHETSPTDQVYGAGEVMKPYVNISDSIINNAQYNPGESKIIDDIITNLPNQTFVHEIPLFGLQVESDGNKKPLPVPVKFYKETNAIELLCHNIGIKKTKII